MQPSSRTPEGEWNDCPVCGNAVCIDPSRPPGDAPCPYCGHLLWFGPIEADGIEPLVKSIVERQRKRESAWDFGYLIDELISRCGNSKSTTKELCNKVFQEEPDYFCLGHYRILEPLARGRKSLVFLAEHRVMNRRVVLKILPDSLSKQPEQMNRFRQQAIRAAVLDHPGIVRCYDVDSVKLSWTEIAFLVSQHVEGEDLEQIVARKGPLAPREAAEYIGQAADALAYGHQAGVTHGNVRSSHILIDPTGKVKILGFGTHEAVEKKELSEAVGSARDPSPRTGVIKTVLRLFRRAKSVEKTAVADLPTPKEETTIDRWNDIFQLGGTFFHVLTGESSFSVSSPLADLMLDDSALTESFSRLVVKVPASLLEIIRCMASPTSSDGFGSMEEVADELRAWQDGAKNDV